MNWDDEGEKVHVPSYYQVHVRNREDTSSYEYLKERSEQVVRFFDRAEQVHFIDSHRFPTTPALLSQLAKYMFSRRFGKRVAVQNLAPEAIHQRDFEFFIHGTNVLLNDKSNRKFVEPQMSLFRDTLQKFFDALLSAEILSPSGKFGATDFKLYYKEEPYPPFEKHFLCLEEFELKF